MPELEVQIGNSGFCSFVQESGGAGPAAVGNTQNTETKLSAVFRFLTKSGVLLLAALAVTIAWPVKSLDGGTDKLRTILLEACLFVLWTLAAGITSILGWKLTTVLFRVMLLFFCAISCLLILLFLAWPRPS